MTLLRIALLLAVLTAAVGAGLAGAYWMLDAGTEQGAKHE